MAGLLVVATLLVDVASGRRLGVAVADDASYAVTLDGAAWLRSAPLAVFVDGRWWTGADLRRDGPVARRGGAATQRWIANATAVETAVVDAGDDVLVFETRFPGGAAGTRSGVADVPGGWTGDKARRGVGSVFFSVCHRLFF